MVPTSSFRVADDSFMTRQLDKRVAEKMQPQLLTLCSFMALTVLICMTSCLYMDLQLVTI